MTTKRVLAWPTIQVVRAYDISDRDHGYRVLVDRLWPRGINKEALDLDEWAKDLAPSSALRRWFNHDPTRWDEFRQRYFSELAGQVEWLAALHTRVKARTLLLLYGAKSTEFNNAVALRDYLITHAGPA